MKISILFKNLLVLLAAVLILVIVVFTTGLIPDLKLYSVLTGSMEPTIPEGSLIFIRNTGDYQEGDIITFETPTDGKVLPPTTHRITAVEEIGDGRIDYTTRGDANNADDTEVIPNSRVIGEVTNYIPLLGKLLSFVRTPIGALIVVILPSAFIIFSEFNKIRENVTIMRKSELQPPREEETLE